MAADERIRLDDVERKVCDIASEQLGIRRDRILPGDRIVEDLQCDSLDLVELFRTPAKVRSERGGSWIGPADLCRSSFRRGRPPAARGRCLGFRCIGSVQGVG